MLSSKDSINIGANYLGRANFNNKLNPVSRLGTLSGKTLAMYIKDLFANNEIGFAYDINDLSTLFQDAAGTIPVTGAGQPVGLVLDKSGRGNHARQTTSAARPIFQQTPILGANFVTDSTLAEPSKWNTGVTSGVSISDNKLIFNNVTAYHAAIASSLSTKLTVGKRYLLSYIISGYVSGAVRAQLIGGASINTNNFNKNGRVSLVITTTAGHSFIGFQSVVAGTTLNISEVYLQEITGYLTDQNYLQFDGVDDFLQTNSIDFTATDKVSLFAGVRKLSDATTAALCEFSDNSTSKNGTFSFFAPTSPNPQYQFRSKGTSASVYASSPTNAYPAPHSTVLTGFGSPPQNIARLRVNGIQVADTPTGQGSSVYGNYPLYIGRRGGISLPFNGHLYSLIGIGRLTTDSETIALEKSIAKNVGVTL